MKSAPHPEARPARPRFPIRAKMLVSFTALSLGPLLVLAALSIYQTERILDRRVTRELLVEVTTAAEAVEVYLSGVRRELLGLSRFVLRMQTEAEAGRWQAVEEEFLQAIRAEPSYYQIRFIDAGGMERVRINNIGGMPIPVPPDELQYKGDRYYFKDAMATEPGRTYVSPLDFNIERGRIEEPRRLVTRLATAVVDQQGKLFGIVVINVFAEEMLQVLRRAEPLPGLRILLIDEGNRFVEMRQENGRPTFRTGWRRQLQTEFEGKIPTSAEVPTQSIFARDSSIFASSRVVASPDNAWLLMKVYPRASLYADLDRLHHTMLLLAIPLVLFASLFGFFMARSFSRPIRELSAFAGAIADGDYLRHCEIKSHDELGQLSAALHAMGRALAESRAKLLDWNESLKQEVAHKVAELEDSEEKYRLIFSAESDAILIFDCESRQLIEANEAAAEMYGYDRGEMIGLHVTEISAEPSVSMSRVDRIMAGELRFIPLGYHKRKDGTPFPVEIASGTYTWKRRKMFIGIIRDITERQKIDEMKDEMLSAVSHEMRTPLTAIIGYIEFMLENEVAPSDARQYHLTIQQESERLKGLIDNLLSLQRLRSGFGGPHFDSVPIPPLLSGVAALFSHLSEKHRVAVDCPRDLPLLQADEELLHQALDNLVGNAIKYSEGGTVTLGARQEEENIILWVRDEGSGIPDLVVEHIFERFFRIDTKDGARIGGTGLGLPLVKEIVKAHGGMVWVDSRLGEGSTFYMSIPRVQKPAES